MLYMAVTTDKYELPIYVTDTARELGEHFGKTENDVHSAISKNLSGKIQGYKFVRVYEDKK